MLIPGSFISILTFPGVIVHELAHKFFCDKAGVPVYEVVYFRIGTVAGYVRHGEVKGLRNAFLISVGPLIVNSVLCMVLTLPMGLSGLAGDLQVRAGFLYLLWVGISIGMHAFPSNQDMRTFLYFVKSAKKGGAFYVMAWIFALLIRIANILSIFWFDLIYAVLLSLILPMLLMFLMI